MSEVICSGAVQQLYIVFRLYLSSQVASSFLLFQSYPHVYKIAAGTPAITHVSGIRKEKGRAKAWAREGFLF